MAIFAVGPFGRPSGKIGNVVFYELNGQIVGRGIGKAGKPSKKQLANRQAMSATMDFLKPMTDFINVSFKSEAEGSLKNPHNLATSYNKKNALTGEYPNIRVDYTKAILSKGQLESANQLKISKGENGLHLSWDSSVAENGENDDLLMVMISHPGRKRASSYLNAARRVEGICYLPLAKDWMMEEQMEIYVCFKSANGKLISDSTYVGNLNGAPATKEQKAVETQYHATKTRYDLVAANYDKKRLDFAEGIPESKAFRCLETEYFALKSKLLMLQEKPS
ncbi:hypothetical protein AQ505_02875 [Pedobacter sp. PACM 27299]|uniref:DUF6266 family protein n=1 Tax=Pedobacter sp. PACM 27299 TaxID=1727164 RepID=UPI0007056B96|nr:DUF6266 family protein [Pedobacter sp. PACM 27299]ALL04528.1 hypothetical protein AQ505_02875 [Pedobacter sp. PACM 27299]